MYVVDAYKNHQVVMTHKFVQFKNFRSFYINLVAQLNDNSIDYDMILVKKYDDNDNVLGNFAVLRTALLGPIVQIVDMLNRTTRSLNYAL